MQTTEYMSRNDFFELLLQWKLSFIRVYSQVIWRAFSSTFWNCFIFQTSLWFGFLMQYFMTMVFSFSVWCFRMEINSLPDLLNSGFTIDHWNVFVLWWLTQEAKIRRYQTLTRWQCLLNRGTFWFAERKNKYWFSSSNPSLNYWTYFPKNFWWV